MDWIDEFLEDEPITVSQIAIIEGLLVTVPYSPEVKLDIEKSLLTLTREEAAELIIELRRNDRPIDPREQFKRFNF